jgi:hypothetical protein
MYETANKVLEAARDLGLGSDEFRQVAPGQWERILKQVFDRFADTYETNVTWLWSHLKNQGAAIQTENGLKYLGSLVKPETQVWLLFEDWDEKKKQGNYWVFEGTYGAAVGVLNNMHCIEYYIADRKLNWMIMENHHDFLIGTGEPAESFILNLRAAQQGVQGKMHQKQ